MRTVSNLKQFPELSKPIMKTYFHGIFLTHSKLLIRYTDSNHKKHSLTFNPLDACKLLKELGYIDKYILKNGIPVILEETSWCVPHSVTGEPIEYTGYNDVEWKDYVKAFNKQPISVRYWVGKYLFDWCIMQQENEAYRQKMYSIQPMIKSIA